jgi:hypothetical protein
MLAQFFVEFLRPLLRKEDAGAFEPNNLPRARDGGGEPIGPFDIEVDVVGTPDDKCGRPQLLQLCFDPGRMGRIEGGQEAREITRTLRRSQVWLEIRVDGLVRDLLRMLVSRPLRLR